MSQNAHAKTEVKDVKKLADLKKVETPNTAGEPKKDTNSIASKMNEETENFNFLNPSAETRIKRSEQFLVLGEKFKSLKAMEDNLTKFILSSDGSKEKIELSNNSGFKFVVSNTQTIEKVLDVIQKELSVFIERADTEIKAFII